MGVARDGGRFRAKDLARKRNQRVAIRRLGITVRRRAN